MLGGSSPPLLQYITDLEFSQQLCGKTRVGWDFWQYSAGLSWKTWSLGYKMGSDPGSVTALWAPTTCPEPQLAASQLRPDKPVHQKSIKTRSGSTRTKRLVRGHWCPQECTNSDSQHSLRIDRATGRVLNAYRNIDVPPPPLKLQADGRLDVGSWHLLRQVFRFSATCPRTRPTYLQAQGS